MDRLVVGLVPSDRLRERDPRTRAFRRALEQRIGLYVVERNVSSYDELEQAMALGHVDLAWLPPLVFARLEQHAVAVAIATLVRSGNYGAALVTASTSRIQTLDQLQGSRMAWVDPLSASGHVVARLGLVARGIDPRTTFAREFFAGSHAEALRAVLEGRADVAAVFANLDATGNVVRGPWAEIGVPADRVRVLAVVGEVPPDLVATRASVPHELQHGVAAALMDMAADPSLAPVLEAIFGVSRFAAGAPASYVWLREVLASATTDAYASTSPPSASK
jgi:phosphate/phosphite/phosphonate ABC transporter binding protein